MANITACLYGRSGTYKTSQVGFLAKLLFERTFKPLRYVSADGGGWRPIQNYIDAGIIEPYSILNEPNPIYVMHQLVQGFWPTELENGLRKSGKLKQDTSSVSGIVFEGITTIAERFIDHLAGKKLGMNPSYSLVSTSKGESITTSENKELSTKSVVSTEQFTDESGKALGDYASGAYSQDHYGHVQKEVIAKILLSWSLPVELVMWTGHEAQGEDDLTRSTVRGPALVGKKGTPKIGRNVGMLIHAEPYTFTVKENNKDVEKTEVRYYFMSHPDRLSPKIIWDCKPRVPAELMPELLKEYKEGYFVPGFDGGLDKFLKVEERLLNKGTEGLKEWKERLLRERENKE